jgi:hypothetical protein
MDSGKHIYVKQPKGEPGASKSFKGASNISEEGIMEEFYNLDKTCKTLKTVWFCNQ